MTGKVRTLCRQTDTSQPLDALLRQLNPALKGWCVYFRPGVSSAAFGQRLDAQSADDRRVDVRVVFCWSYRALTVEAARFFRHLAFHPGPAISAQAAASLAGSEMTTVRRCE